MWCCGGGEDSIAVVNVGLLVLARPEDLNSQEGEIFVTQTDIDLLGNVLEVNREELTLAAWQLKMVNFIDLECLYIFNFVIGFDQVDDSVITFVKLFDLVPFVLVEQRLVHHVSWFKFLHDVLLV